MAATLLLLAILRPQALGPLEKVFARVARVVTAALTYLVLTITFFFVITPMGLVMRLLRRDPLALKAAPDQSSFWIEVRAGRTYDAAGQTLLGAPAPLAQGLGVKAHCRDRRERRGERAPIAGSRYRASWLRRCRRY